MRNRVILRPEPLESRALMSADFRFAETSIAGGLGTANAVAIDSIGNTYTTGAFQGSMSFGSGASAVVLNAGSSVTDVYVAKYSPQGALLWAKDFQGSGSIFNSGYGIAVDTDGSVVATGLFGSTVDFDPGVGTAALTTTGSVQNAFVAKLDASGNFVWAKQFQGAASGSGTAVAINAAHAIAVTGFFSGTTDFDPGVNTRNITSSGGQDAFVVQLTAAGELDWVDAFGAASNDFGTAVAFDQANRVYAVGSYQGSVDFDSGPGTTVVTSKGGVNGYVVRLSGSGDLGWARSLGSAGFNELTAVAVTPNGSAVYTTGDFHNTSDFDPGAGTANLVALGRDLFVSALDSSGNYLWAKSVGTTGGQTLGKGLALDPKGNIHVVGSYDQSPDFDPGAGVHTLTSAGQTDGFVLTLNPSGNYVDSRSIGGPNNDSLTANAINGDGLESITGAIVAPVTIGSVSVGGPAIPYTLVTQINSTRAYAPSDFDGDGISDLAVYRPGVGLWIVRKSTGGQIVTLMGDPNQHDVAAVGDYDGDGIADFAVYRPGAALWIIRQSSGGTITAFMGDPNQGDIAAPGDYDGDGKTDLAVYRPGVALWIIRQSSGGTITAFMGDPNQRDISAPGDYDADGKTDLAVYRPGVALWIIRHSTGGTVTAFMGDPSQHDISAPGDYDGDGKTDLAVYRPSIAFWIIRRSTGGTITALMGDPNQGDIAVEASPYFMSPAIRSAQVFVASVPSEQVSAYGVAESATPAANRGAAVPNGSITKANAVWRFGTNLTG
jgi:hypothetical protein